MSEAGPSRAPVWMLALLAGSLALNLFFVGLLGGAWFGDGREKRGAGDRNREFAQVLQTVPEDRREDLREILFRSRDERRGDRAARDTLRESIDDALGATPFDPDALSEASDAYIGMRTERYRDRTMRLGEFVATLDPDEREALVAAMREWRERRRQRWRRDQER